MLTEGISETIVHWNNDEQEIVPGGDCVEPVSSRTHPTSFDHSLSVSSTDILSVQSIGNQNFELGTGDCNDGMYVSNVNEVDCTNAICNKRTSYAGQDWSVGRPGNRPIGASDVAHNSQMCLGPFATFESRQSPHMGHNTYDLNEASSRQLRQEEQSTSHPTASSSMKPIAAKDHVSPVIVALHPHKPPYFSGGLDDDVHVWTSIVNRWLDTVREEPSTQLTYIVSLLRGAAFEWYTSMEAHTGCPGDWATLCKAMLECFGSSIHADKACATLLQMTQGNMTVLQYADAFESCLAQLEDYNESFYLTKFIFGLCPAILTEVFVQRLATLLEAKRIAEELELTQMMMKRH